MSLRTLRERKHLSQEQLAEASGLSLRTVQRAEAGHRVGYASLRALAATFDMDVDLLERELYAMSKPTEEFVEVPLWVRILSGRGWMATPVYGPREARILEGIFLALAVAALIVSLVGPRRLVNVFRFGAVVEFMVAYLISVSSRIIDKYRLWPSAEELAAAKRLHFLRPRSAMEWRLIAFLVTLAAISIVVEMYVVAHS